MKFTSVTQTPSPHSHSTMGKRDSLNGKNVVDHMSGRSTKNTMIKIWVSPPTMHFGREMWPLKSTSAHISMSGMLDGLHARNCAAILLLLRKG